MKKTILALLALLTISMFLVSCAPKVSDEEIEKQLEGKSDAELDEIIAETEKGEGGAVVGKAVLPRATNNQIAKVAYKKKLELKCIPKKHFDFCSPESFVTCGTFDDGCGGTIYCGDCTSKEFAKGKVCENNKCVIKESFCFDSDGGDLSKQGKISAMSKAGGSTNVVDICYDNTHVIEYYCTEITVGGQKEKTFIGKVSDCKTVGIYATCENGACVKTGGLK